MVYRVRRFEGGGGTGGEGGSQGAGDGPAGADGISGIGLSGVSGDSGFGGGSSDSYYGYGDAASGQRPPTTLSPDYQPQNTGNRQTFQPIYTPQYTDYFQGTNPFAVSQYGQAPQFDFSQFQNPFTSYQQPGIAGLGYGMPSGGYGGIYDFGANPYGLSFSGYSMPNNGIASLV